MDENNRFNHIKVSPAEEDDVVIYAGAPSTDTHDVPVDPLDAPLADEVEEISKFEGSDPHKARDSQAPDPDARAHDARSKHDSYEETTLEDIEGSKMSVTQKVIIVIAVLAVIAFVVYSILFM